jgi:hypothetical protein
MTHSIGLATQSNIVTIRELASRFSGHERNLTLYFADLETAPAPGSLNRVFGPPVGLTDEQWPTFPELAELLMQAGSMQHWDPRDHRMEHLFTVDLRGVELYGVPADAVAMTLFISNASFHRACADGNPHTAVRFLREHDLRHGPYRGALPRRSLYRWSRRFSLVPVAVPGDVFDVPELDLPADDPLAALYAAIAQAPARLGGCPIWAREPDPTDGWAASTPTAPWAGAEREAPRMAPAMPASFVQGPGRAQESSLTLAYDAQRVSESSRTVAFDPQRVSESSRTVVRPTSHRRPAAPFLMQFQRRFADVDLGQRGVMYVSERSAYVQSH